MNGIYGTSEMRRGVVVAISLSILLSTLSLPDGRNVERWKGEQWHPYEPAHRCSILMDNDSAAHFIYHQNDRHIEHWFEWWYLNIKGDDGNNLLVEFFTFRNLSNPLTSLVGVVVLFMPADGSTFESVKTYPFIRYTLDYEKCNVTIDGDRFSEVAENEYAVRYHNNVNDVNLMLNVSGVTESLSGLSMVLEDWQWMEWRSHVPLGKAKGVFSYRDFNGYHEYHICGRGYHDHNWGIAKFRSLDWEWGEFSNSEIPLSVVYGLVRSENDSFTGGLYFSDETTHYALLWPDIHIEYEGWEWINGFKKPVKLSMHGTSNNVSANVTIVLERAYVVGIGTVGMPYLMGKLSGEVEIHGKRYTLSSITGFYEHHFFNWW